MHGIPKYVMCSFPRIKPSKNSLSVLISPELAYIYSKVQRNKYSNVPYQKFLKLQ